MHQTLTTQMPKVDGTVLCIFKPLSQISRRNIFVLTDTYDNINDVTSLNTEKIIICYSLQSYFGTEGYSRKYTRTFNISILCRNISIKAKYLTYAMLEDYI